MSLLQLVRISIGDVGVKPGEVRMLSTADLATITTAGYLNGAGLQVKQIQLSPTDFINCSYSYNSSTGSALFVTLTASVSNGVITLSVANNLNTLSSGNIFVGNASNVPTSVALSGDATLSNAGALTIANNAITTAKILNANVTLAKLAAGIAPSHVIKFAGTQANGGGSATIAITVTGLTTSYIPFAQLQSSTNAVTIQKVTPSSNTITVLLSGDPGAGTVISYEALLAAA